MSKIEPTFAILVLIDIANSTKFIEKVGDIQASKVFRVYDRIFRSLLIKYEGIEIDKTDGALLIFENMKGAIQYVFEYHHLVEKHLKLQSRVGIHCGIVMMHNNSSLFVSRGAKPVEVEGLQKAVGARIMSLAEPGQTLMSPRASQIAMSIQSQVPKKFFIKHVGDYSLKGVKKPMPIHTIATSRNRLYIPKNKGKVKRVKPPKLSTKEKRIRFFKRYILPFILIFMYEVVCRVLYVLHKFGYVDVPIVENLITFNNSVYKIFNSDFWENLSQYL